MVRNTTEYGQKFTSLLRKIVRAHRAKLPDPHDPITELINGFLQWNASRRMANSALNRIDEAVVDHNELRVSHDDEIVTMIGDSYPLVTERAARLRESLQEIFVRQHTLSLECLVEKSKKEARSYLESLPGMVPYVAAHAMLLCFDGHAVPVDDRLAELLRHEEVVDPNAGVEEITVFLERRILADSALQSYVAMKAWSDAGTRRISTARTSATSRKSGGAKKTTSKAGRSRVAARSNGRRTKAGR